MVELRSTVKANYLFYNSAGLKMQTYGPFDLIAECVNHPSFDGNSTRAKHRFSEFYCCQFVTVFRFTLRCRRRCSVIDLGHAKPVRNHSVTSQS